MNELLFVGSALVIASCALYLWINPAFEDCFWGRVGLLGSLWCCGVIIVSSTRYIYTDLQPEVVWLFVSQAGFMLWMAWRVLKDWWKEKMNARHRTAKRSS